MALRITKIYRPELSTSWALRLFGFVGVGIMVAHDPYSNNTQNNAPIIDGQSRPSYCLSAAVSSIACAARSQISVTRSSSITVDNAIKPRGAINRPWFRPAR